MKLFFTRKFICVKEQDFYIKRQLSYKNIFCKKKAAFLQKYISVKRQFFYNRPICKKPVFLTTIQFVKKPLLYKNIYL